MTDRKLSAFVDALVAGRRPGSFKAEPADAEVVRTAIALRAARPGDAIPDEAFVSDLHQKLSDQATSTPASNVRPLKVRRARAALVGIAASVALVGGTVVATDSFKSHGGDNGCGGPPRASHSYRIVRDGRRQCVGADRRLWRTSIVGVHEGGRTRVEWHDQVQAPVEHRISRGCRHHRASPRVR